MNAGRKVQRAAVAQPADEARHSGLANMHRRADDIAGTLAITSRPGSGTRVEITAPLA